MKNVMVCKMHISSSRSYGQSSIKRHDFASRFLGSKTKQRYWQILLLGQQVMEISPYQSFSAFAGNTHFTNLISGESKVCSKPKVLGGVELWRRTEVDYAKIYYARRPFLEKQLNASWSGRMPKILRSLLKTTNHGLNSFIYGELLYLTILLDRMARCRCSCP